MKLSDSQKGLIIVLAAAFIFGGILFVNRIWQGDAFSKEEAQHALYSVFIAKDLGAFDWGSFWYDTQRQMYWPFLHSWIQGIFFLIFGVSYVSARALSLIIFVSTLVLMYRAAARFSERSGWKVGILAVFLALASPMTLRFAVENNLEGLGALLFLAGYYLYVVCEERKLYLYYVALAVLVSFSLYTNYLYAYLMIPAFIVATLGKLGPIFLETSRLARKGEKAAYPFLWWAYRKLVFLSVLLLLTGAWFLTASFSRKIVLFSQAVFRYSGGEVASNFWQMVLFYPRAVVENYAFSPWLGILMIAALLVPAAAFVYCQLNKLYIFVWTAILLLTLTVPTRAPQLIHIVAPFIYLVFSAAVFYWLERLKKYRTAVLAIILIPALLSLPALPALYFPQRPAENMVQVLNYFRQGISPRQALAASINLNHLNPEGIAFHFWDWNAPVLSDAIIGEDEMLRGGQYFLSVELDENSRYRSEILDDSLFSWNAYLQEKLRLGEIREYSRREFNGIGLTARIFEKQSR